MLTSGKQLLSGFTIQGSSSVLMAEGLKKLRMNPARHSRRPNKDLNHDWRPINTNYSFGNFISNCRMACLHPSNTVSSSLARCRWINGTMITDILSYFHWTQLGTRRWVQARHPTTNWKSKMRWNEICRLSIGDYSMNFSTRRLKVNGRLFAVRLLQSMQSCLRRRLWRCRAGFIRGSFIFEPLSSVKSLVPKQLRYQNEPAVLADFIWFVFASWASMHFFLWLRNLAKTAWRILKEFFFYCLLLFRASLFWKLSQCLYLQTHCDLWSVLIRFRKLSTGKKSPGGSICFKKQTACFCWC